MKISDIDKVELQYLNIEDYNEIKDVMTMAYSSMPNSYWKEKHIVSLLNKFPEGQVVIKVNGDIAGCALSIIVDYSGFEKNHTYRDITANYTFDSHNDEGDVLYGIDVFIKPEYLGFFHTGAYQDSVSGYGGIKHCLIPSPKHVIIDKDEQGNIIDTVYREEQSVKEMFKILGYND